jgi:UTP--glucose-1-phosphate uridylyltransferase
MSPVRKAVIAVAGSGTRFLPVTKAMPKEMLPIVDKPIIQLIVEELVEAGIQDIILVTKWDKRPLEDHFDQNWALVQELRQTGKEALLATIDRLSELANFVYIRQRGPYGNGTPVLSAMSLLGDEPFLYAWGDDLVKSTTSFSKQLVDDFAAHGIPMIGVQEVPRDEVSRYGIVKLRPGTQEIEDIIEKPTVEQAPSQLADFGRMILNKEIVDILKQTSLGKNNELWIVDAIRDYVRGGGKFLAKTVTSGRWLTTGDPLNYLQAVLAYAMDREGIREPLLEYMADLVEQNRVRPSDQLPRVRAGVQS